MNVMVTLMHVHARRTINMSTNPEIVNKVCVEHVVVTLVSKV